jgi:hypothetical protein
LSCWWGTRVGWWVRFIRLNFCRFPSSQDVKFFVRWFFSISCG